MLVNLLTVSKRINDLYIPSDTPELSVQCEIRGGISLTAPIFVLTGATTISYWKYNYVFVPKWERYYFINDVDIDGNIIYLSCNEDFLASFYDVITNSTFYCTRSYSDYDESLTDTFFPCQAFSSTKQKVITSPWQDVPNGQYVIAITSGGNNAPHIGTNSYYIMDDDEITDFMNDLLSKANLSISGLIDSLVKTMVNPIQYIRSVFWFPFVLDCETVDVNEISFGWWSSSASAKVINGNHATNLYSTYEVTIEYDESLFDDNERMYKKFAPYSQYRLVCYPFGVIDLSNDIISQYVSENPIVIKIVIDHITGMADFILHCGEGNNIPHLVFTTQLAIEIPVGEILQNYAGVALNSIGAIGSVASGNVIGAINDVYNAIDSVVPSATVQGIAGGFAQLMIGESWFLNRYVQDINIDNELVGEPCCKNERVGDLHGYARFSNVEIKGNMLESEMNAINSLLENGIFIGEN